MILVIDLRLVLMPSIAIGWRPRSSRSSTDVSSTMMSVLWRSAIEEVAGKGPRSEILGRMESRMHVQQRSIECNESLPLFIL